MVYNLDKVYLVCYSDESGTYTSHIAFVTKELAEDKCLEFMEKDGLDWYTIDVPLIAK